MTRWMKAVLARGALLGVLMMGGVFPVAGATTAAPPTLEAAKSLVSGMAGEAISVLSDPRRTDDQIHQTFHAILAKNFDLPGIARFVMGRAWRTATPEQQTEYVPLFENYVVGIYANRFKDYAGETLSVTEARADGDAVIVASRINMTKGAAPVLVEWKITEAADGKPRVSDVIIEQVSMSLTQRSEFSTIIQNNGGQVDSLLALLRERTRGDAPARARP